MDFIDLHVHTTASDGTMTPRELVNHAAASGLRTVAITDHDTVEGLAEAITSGADAKIEVVPGVEISVDFSGEMHILGYFIDYKNQAMNEALQKLRQYRDQRNPRIIEKLKALGFDITMEEVAGVSGGTVIGRPHFAAIMVKKGYVKDAVEAFELYLGAGKKAYVKKDRLSPEEGIALINDSGGVAVLAHPKYVKLKAGNDLDNVIKELIGCGLKGIEAYYTEHTPEETNKYLDLARRYSLIVTGGTDFHGANKPKIKIGTGRGNLKVSYELMKQFNR